MARIAVYFACIAKIPGPKQTVQMNRSNLIHPSRVTSLLLLPALALCGFSAPARSQAPEAEELFEKKIRPLFVRHCMACHNSELATAGLDLSTAEGFRRGMGGNPLISVESVSQSRLLKAVRYQDAVKMPPAGQLDPAEIADLETWIGLGAPWPEAIAETGEAPEVSTGLWSLEPVADPGPPPVARQDWARTPIDRFVLAKLEEQNLEPAPPADKLTLLRRATFDLTGLPPSVQDIERFLNDTSPDAFDKVIGRLLDSPRYGEHWGRHWLDVARYADSTGNDEDHKYPHAWRYRDYVIDVFNRDLPYDQFILEQVAGDLLPRTGRLETDRRRIIATGFLALGPKAIAQQDKIRMVYDVYDEQLDVVSRSVLGLSITCARCHDHKFDPILTRDYYSLISVFASTRSFVDPTSHVSEMFMKPLVLPEEHQVYLDHKKKIDDRKQAQGKLVEKEKERFAEAESRRLADYMLAAHRVYAQGADPAELSRTLELKESILERWAGYLKPGQGFRPHLLAWRRSGEDQRPSVARDYQDKFRAPIPRVEPENWRPGGSASRSPGRMKPRRTDPGSSPAGTAFSTKSIFRAIRGTRATRRRLSSSPETPNSSPRNTGKPSYGSRRRSSNWRRKHLRNPTWPTPWKTGRWSSRRSLSAAIPPIGARMRPRPPPGCSTRGAGPWKPARAAAACNWPAGSSSRSIH